MKWMMLYFVIFLVSSCGDQDLRRSKMFGLNGASSDYLVGVGSADVTGPVYGIGTLGYAAPTPVAAGILQRLKARSFLVSDRLRGSLVAIVVVDTAFISWSIKDLVLQSLSSAFPGEFSHSNLVLSATHTHSAPGAYSNSHYYNIPFSGISDQNIETLVAGIVQSVTQARSSLTPGSIKYNKELLKESNINRSLMAYLNNPLEERNLHSASTDQWSEQLTFLNADSQAIGLLNLFSVHATSVEKDYKLIHGDHKGLASYMVERHFDEDDRLSSDSFVAAFATKASGDSSPNTAMDVDQDGDWDCLQNENLACAQSIAQNQALSAKRLVDAQGVVLTGPIYSKASYLDMENQKFSMGDFQGETCTSAVGFAMIAGSEEDGPGIGREGQRCSDATGIQRARCRINRCHGEKSVAVPTGLSNPKWIVPKTQIQIVEIGPLVLTSLPGEFTTMSGRRVVSDIQTVYGDQSRIYSMIGYANDFFGYTATQEEYQLQHYEGGHTVFGEHQLGYLRSQYQKLASMPSSDPVSGISAPQINYALFDRAKVPFNDDVASITDFGAVLKQPSTSYAAGDVVTVDFKSSNPNHGVRKLDGFFTIQRLSGDTWLNVLTDHDFETSIEWSKKENYLVARVEWRIPVEAQLIARSMGKYRILFYGVRSSTTAEDIYRGQSEVFQVE